MKTVTLKPCPFCGGDDAEIKEGAPNGYFVSHVCGWNGFASTMYGYRCSTEEEAVAAWNLRAAPQPPEAPSDAGGVIVPAEPAAWRWTLPTMGGLWCYGDAPPSMAKKRQPLYASPPPSPRDALIAEAIEAVKAKFIEQPLTYEGEGHNRGIEAAVAALEALRNGGKS